MSCLSCCLSMDSECYETESKRKLRLSGRSSQLALIQHFTRFERPREGGMRTKHLETLVDAGRVGRANKDMDVDGWEGY